MQEDFRDRSYRMADLVARFIRGTLSAEESVELDAWLEEDPKNREFFEKINDPQWQKRSFEFFDDMDENGAWDAVSVRVEEEKPEPKVSGGKNRKKFYIVATILFALLVIGVGFWTNRKDPVEKSAFGQEIAPGFAHAVLFLSGRKVAVSLDGSEPIEDGVASRNGWVVYASDNRDTGEHKLVVPDKGTYAVVLQDGTKVWLNAGSSLRYPSRFTGPDRVVELVGEGFFAVAKDAAHPFRVLCQGTETEAVGTAFNVNGYRNEVTTTLVEGRVKVGSAMGKTYLSPGQSATFNSRSLPPTAQADTVLATGWKNGNFVFLHTDFQEVMDQLSHWYGVEIDYQKGFRPEGLSFTGELPRNEPISKLLSLMEMTGIASFRVAGNTLSIYTATGDTGR